MFGLLGANITNYTVHVLTKPNCEISYLYLTCFVQVTSDHLLIMFLYYHFPDTFQKLFSYLAVGTKIDLQHKREVTKEDGEKFALENKFDLFLETSAKTGENVQEVSS